MRVSEAGRALGDLVTHVKRVSDSIAAIGDSTVVDEMQHMKKRLNRPLLRMLAHQALLKTCQAVDAAGDNA